MKKKYIYAGWIKVLAVALIYISILTGLGSVVCVLLTQENDFMVGYRNIFENQAAELLDDNVDSDSPDYSELDDGNLSYAVLRTREKVLEDLDLTDQEIYLYQSEDFNIDKYQYCFEYVDTYRLYYNTSSLFDMLNETWVKKTVSTHSYEKAQADGKDNSEESYKYWVLGSIRSPMEKKGQDPFYQWNCWVGGIQFFARASVVVVLFSVLIGIGAFAYLMKAAGHRPNREGIVLAWTDKVWFGPFWCIIAGIQLLFGCLMLAVAEAVGQLSLELLVEIELILAAFILCLGLLGVSSTVVRFKAHCFWNYTFLHILCKPLKICRKWLRREHKRYRQRFCFLRETVNGHLPLVAKTVILLAAVNFVEFLFCVFMLEMSMDFGTCFLTVILCKLVEGVIVVLIALQMARLKEGGERIAAGDLKTSINTNGMFWEFRRHGENINKVGEGINLAVKERMKSEHFKTELITNVSHDIKTPLTSIINYVDLMKKLDITDETMLEYMDVLDRQSARLKKLIEDLMEASKASTGNLEVNLERCDVSVLFTQMIGEYKERAAEGQLQFVVRCPEESVYIMADGRHLWRVFDNLLVNICKYAMPGTRVYIDLIIETGKAVIIFKNISKQPLNIGREELMERFVRGDSSRNTEGNGLGLSIAQSLTELMSGTLTLDVDGDLFKVTLRFPVV